MPSHLTGLGQLLADFSKRQSIPCRLQVKPVLSGAREAAVAPDGCDLPPLIGSGPAMKGPDWKSDRGQLNYGRRGPPLGGQSPSNYSGPRESRLPSHTVCSLVSDELLALRTCQGGDDARVIGWPQAGRRPIGWFVADKVDVLHCECTAQQNQVDTVVELRLRIQQIGVLATRRAGPPWVPSVG